MSELAAKVSKVSEASKSNMKGIEKISKEFFIIMDEKSEDEGNMNSVMIDNESKTHFEMLFHMLNNLICYSIQSTTFCIVLFHSNM